MRHTVRWLWCTCIAVPVLLLADRPVSVGGRARAAPQKSEVAAAMSASVAPVHRARRGIAGVPRPRVVDAQLASEAERLVALARYPSWSQPLDLIGDPIAAAQHDAPRIEVSGSEGEAPVLTVFAERRSFDAPEPMLIRAYLSEANRSVPASMMASVRDAAARPIAELQFTAEGLPDRSGLQRYQYVAAFEPVATEAPSAGYLIHVHARSATGEQREAQLILQYNQPYAHLTGEFRDRFDAGDLVVEAQVQVAQPAAYRIDGSLYAQSDQRPLAWAEVSASLSAGVHWLELRYHGLMLRELGSDGPYVLRFAQLHTQTPAAASNSRALENGYVTQAYDADAFSGEPVNDAEKLTEAAQLRARLGRGAAAH